MKYELFAREIEAQGLYPKRCHHTHWQILGGDKHRVVNVWPNSKLGFRFQADEQKARAGTVQDAIDLAGVPPASVVAAPWEVEPKRVGLIRWLWRLIW